ncbi:MAG: GNAT family N-acetyltransferase [Dehalococcoidales bacterium]|nr:GNAT family N-acetyltransferase [Dehalococcoidales bacterium]
MRFRFAEKKDAGLVLDFIKELAAYEKMDDEVVNTKEMIEDWVFDRHYAEVLFVMEDDKEAGFALFFYNYSTFVGRAGLWLEDLFVRPDYRGKGYGKALLEKLASIAVERGYGRMEWNCLDWNKSSIDFYLSEGAVPMDIWTTYRLTGDALTKAGNG